MEVTFGEYIKQRRGELGFPLRKVASHIDIDPSTLGKIEKDERCLNLEHLDRLSTILQTDKKTLFKLPLLNKNIGRTKRISSI